MTSKNPFGQLNIRRDDDEEERMPVKNTPQQVSVSQPQLQQSQNQQKKKKVRPEEKKKSDEVEDNEEFEGGFSVVKKSKAPVKSYKAAEEEGVKVEKKEYKKGEKKERSDKAPTQKRQFERHSGTGRGKEISKGGAGGKHTWGANPRNIAKGEREEYNNDEALFSSALNPNPKPRREFREKNEEKKEEEKPEVVEPEKTEETPKQEAAAEEVADEKDWDKRKKKKGVVVEVNKEDLLERPENAVSLAEYLEQLKLKNQAISTKKPVNVPTVDNSDLKPKTKDEDLTIGANIGTTKTNKTKKEKKTTDGAKELTVAFQTEDNSTFERKYDNKDNNRNYKGKGNRGPKFQFNNEEFPEL